jgi:hypothetical protein
MPRFDSPAPITATVEVVVGDLRVTADERTETTVEIRPSDPGADLDVQAAEQTRVEFTDGRLLVKGPKQRGLGLFGRTGSIDVDLRLPAGSRLDSETGIAAITVTGAIGPARIKTGVGDVRVDRTGSADINTGSGSITVIAVEGDAHLTTGTGDLRVGTVTGDATLKNSTGETRVGSVGGTLRINASQGDILVDRAVAGLTARSGQGAIRVGEVAGGPVEMKTSMGELEIGIPAGVAAHLDLHTQFGNVRSRLDASDAPEPGDRAVEVRGRTSYGDIVIRRAS